MHKFFLDFIKIGWRSLFCSEKVDVCSVNKKLTWHWCSFVFSFKKRSTYWSVYTRIVHRSIWVNSWYIHFIIKSFTLHITHSHTFAPFNNSHIKCLLCALLQRRHHNPVVYVCLRVSVRVYLCGKNCSEWISCHVWHRKIVCNQLSGQRFSF